MEYDFRVCMCVCRCMFTCVSVHVEARSQPWVMLIKIAVTSFNERGSFTGTGDRELALTGWPRTSRDLSASPSPVWELLEHVRISHLAF